MKAQDREYTNIPWAHRLFAPLLKGKWMTRWFVLVALCFIPLTFFLHFTQTRMEVLEIGTKAPHYVVSQADFSFLDQDATRALRQESARDIGTIYKVPEHDVISYRQNFENRLIELQQWRKELPRTTFEELYAVLDSIQENLLLDRFTDSRTFEKLKTLDFLPPRLSVIPMHSAPAEGETLKIQADVWESIRQEAMKIPQVHKETVDYALHAFSSHAWNLQPDFALLEGIRQAVKAKVPYRYTHIEEGIQIVKKGEVVTERHIHMLQAMKSAMDFAYDWWKPMQVLSSALIALSLVLIAVLHLRFFHKSVFYSFNTAILLVLIILMSLGLAKLTEHLLLSFDSNLIEEIRFPLLMPFVSLLVSILIGTEVAVSISFLLLIIFGISLAVDTIPFLLMNLFASAMTIFFASKMHRRKEVFSVCGKVFLSLIPAILAINFYDPERFGWNCGMDLVSSFLFLLGTAVLALILLPVFESGFGVMTDMALVEYMDPDQELLKRLSLEAPGTYQHSLVVGHIAEAAAKAIGANGLFCRAATLYHDIGKLLNPHYFTENQLGGFNIHQLLTPMESTQVIISHVTEGEMLARKHGLPQGFIDIIREHHGTTMVYYFYCKQVEQMNGDVTRVSSKAFRYFGPKPRSKESAIIMIADTVEAASRSLQEVTERGLVEMVDKLVLKKAEDGQFDECELTFDELGRVKRAMVKSLAVASHLRIKYPDA